MDKQKRINITLDNDTYMKAKQCAKENKRTLNSVIEIALRQVVTGKVTLPICPIGEIKDQSIVNNIELENCKTKGKKEELF